MEIKDAKYLLAYILPLSTVVAIIFGGIFSYSSFIIAFGIIPILELFIRPNAKNLSEEISEVKNNSVFFDILLMLNVVWVYAILLFFFFKLQVYSFENYELVGLVLSIGVMLGSNGINVAHELGHKPQKLHQILAKMLLIPNLYLHFFIEHNQGHHLKVATPEDPATSRFGENIYTFWIRSVFMSFKSAWQIEAKKLRNARGMYSIFLNKIFQYIVLQAIYLSLVFIIFGILSLLLSICMALVGILLLESINYIEHYGLMRKKLLNGRYESVDKHHSWNSDHQVGRILLYELTRHSDHHYKANKKYQILKHYDESPQLPFGYPTSILIALVPILWFKLMNPMVEQWRLKYQ